MSWKIVEKVHKLLINFLKKDKVLENIVNELKIALRLFGNVI